MRVLHCPSSTRPLHLQWFPVPGMCAVTYFWPASILILSKQTPACWKLDRPLCSSLPYLCHGLLYWLWALSFLNMQCGTAHHDIMGHLRRQLVNFTTKTMAHIGWKMPVTHDFCPSLSQARFEVYSAKLESSGKGWSMNWFILHCGDIHHQFTLVWCPQVASL